MVMSARSTDTTFAIRETPQMMPSEVGPVPLVSVIIANHDGGRFIQDALASCLRQTMADIEVIVVDDASGDDSVELVAAAIRDDSRIRLLRTPTRVGPAGARNQAMAVARGVWLAVLDSDDIMHPQRLSQLVELADERDVEIVADNQLVFDDARVASARPLVARDELPAGGVIPLEDYILSNSLSGQSVPLGYLKPLIRRSFLEQGEYRYDTTLKIGEDYDLVVRLLLGGARFHLHPEMMYFYRRHTRSISHRLSAATLLPMLAADDRVRASTTVEHDPLLRLARQALDGRRRSIEHAIDFERLVQDLKARRWKAAISLCWCKPRAAALLRIPLRDRLRRVRLQERPPTAPKAPSRRISLLSRQRIVGTTNGSSAYLISLCSALRGAGYDIDLVSPSPAMFGRRPFLRLDSSMDVFTTIRIRGSFRLGRFVIAKDPRIAGRALFGVLHRLLSRLPFDLAHRDRKAPHAIAVPLTDADRIFIADNTGDSAIILADYVFLNEATPFALQPRVANAVIMHDLFFTQDPQRTVVPVDRMTEMKLLNLADAVVAIQAEEREAVRKHLPSKRVILAPMAVSPAAAPQAGPNGTLLFVGSDTVPNLDGIGWFLAEVWPRLLGLHPNAQLRIAGSCCGSLHGLPPNVTLLGRIDDLAATYRQAGVVISPLRSGSGLKIKLVEALGHGKACVVTATTLQGVRDLVGRAVMQADDASDFLEAIASLLHDYEARSRLAERALTVARRHFSPAACYRDLLTFIRNADPADDPGFEEPADPQHQAC